MSSPLTDDLRFFRFFHISLHFLFILVLIRSFFDAILQYQLLDENIRQLLPQDNDDDDNPMRLSCVNISSIIEDFIIESNVEFCFTNFY